MSRLYRPGFYAGARVGQRPLWPFSINRDSPQTEGLVAWYPALHNPNLTGGTVDLADGLFPLDNVNGTPNTIADSATFPQMGPVFDFVSGANDYLFRNEAVLTVVPVSFAVWFRVEALTGGTQTLCELGQFGSQDRFILVFDDPTAGDPLICQAKQGATNANATTTTGVTVGQWHLATAVFETTTDRRVFIDGGSKGTNATAATPAGLNRTHMARSVSDGFNLNGQIAEVRIYNRALSDAEVRQMWEPRTRWDLYKPIRGRTSPRTLTQEQQELVAHGSFTSPWYQGREF